MAFCENCGNKLNEYDVFCENCGEKVVTAEYTSVCPDKGFSYESDTRSVFSMFQSPDWRKSWKNTASKTTEYEIGIILTREKALLNGLVGASPEALHAAITDYTNLCKMNGVVYYYLDLDNCAVAYNVNNSSQIAELLKSIYTVTRFKYLFILGNEDVIDVARWEDKTEDDDEVESDFCYTTLDITSPWDRNRYDFANALRVGRLPNYNGESFYEFISYFEAVASVSAHGFAGKNVYGLSASTWEDESNNEYNTFAKGSVDVSPYVTIQNVRDRIPPETNIYYVNLHGSLETRYWYGEAEKKFPEAFSPEHLSNNHIPFILGVEACYGAKYTGGLTSDDSILLKAMTSNCVSFVGSSRIAYGTPTPPGTCADKVVGEYLRQITDGVRAGDAFVAGLKKIVSETDSLDDAEAKTIAEFGLYGDPSVFVGDLSQKSFGKQQSKTFSKIHSSSLRVSLPEIRTPVRMELARVNAQIERMIDDFVVSTYFGDINSLSTIRQRVVRLPNIRLNQKIYNRDLKNFAQIVKVYFDDTGKIKKVYESK